MNPINQQGTINQLLEGSNNLYRYLFKNHWDGNALIGPDPGIRFNAHFGRFIKSYLPFIPWSDNLVYAQAQQYWIACNWILDEVDTNDTKPYRDIAISCAKYLLKKQHPEGYWEYPNPEWRNRIATVEGNYAAIGLLESYCQTKSEIFLAGAQKWYEFATSEIGFQKQKDKLAINYFKDQGTIMVPNNSASALRTFALLAFATNENRYLEFCSGMVTFLVQVQLDSGELPYKISNSNNSSKDRIHFLCYQYNAFQLLNLSEYYFLTRDENIWPVLVKLVDFLIQGVTKDGAANYDCHHQQPEVIYYTLAVGAAIRKAEELGIGDFSSTADLAYQRALEQQLDNGFFAFHSRGNYGLLIDRRSYPRYLAMNLFHLLKEFVWQKNSNPKS